MENIKKSLFAYAISHIDWTPMYEMNTCEAQFVYFDIIMDTFKNTIFPFPFYNKDEALNAYTVGHVRV